jgi:hypothetical protein
LQTLTDINSCWRSPTKILRRDPFRPRKCRRRREEYST